MEIPVWGFVTGLILLLSGVSTIVILAGKLMTKAGNDAVQRNEVTHLKEDIKKDLDRLNEELKNYIRKEVFQALRDDVDGIGRKATYIEGEQRKTSERVIAIENSIFTKLENIENMLKAHIENHKRSD